jgi:1-acyl-sn-glycerol-3-phosphate acyltransferase
MFPEVLRRNRNFLCLWAAYGISAFGDHLSELGLMSLMHVKEGHEQTRVTAAMLFVFFLPFFLLSPVAGLVADRLPRKYIMIFADLIRAGVVVSIPLLPVLAGIGRHEALPLHYGLAPLLLVGLFATFFSPARLALLPALVPDEHLVSANSMINGMGTICSMISFLVGGWLASHYLPWTFRCDAITFLVSAACVSMIFPPVGQRRSGETVLSRSGGWWRNMHEGIRYVRCHRRVIHLMIIGALFWMAASAFNSTTTPLVISRYRMPDYAVLGYFRGTLAGGMVLGALLLTVFGDALRSETAITWSLIVGGAALLGLAWTDSIYVGAALAMVLGACGSGVLISASTLTQRIVPDYARGRVFGLSDWVSMAGLLSATGLLGLVPFPLGALDRAVPWVLLAMGVAMIVPGIWVMVWRQQRAWFKPALAFWKNLLDFYCKWWFRMQREGPCSIPPNGPVLIAGNHTSPIDPILMISASPHRIFGFMIAREYYHVPVFGRLVRMIGCIPTTRSGQDTAAIRSALRHLHNGGALGIFPQGRIELAGEQLGPKEGVALLALMGRAIVVPVYISGVRYNDNVPVTFFRRHHARVRYGKPIDLSRYYEHAHDRGVRREVAALIMARIRELAPAGDARAIPG